MGSRIFSKEDLSCPVCCDFYKDPVLLTCTHSICKSCLKKFCETKGSRECPVCRRRNSRDEYPLNPVLKKLCESQREPFCSLHRKELELFCEDDTQLVCVLCRDSKLHTEHNFRPISEAALERREDLKIKLQPLQRKLSSFKQAKTTCDDTAQHMRMQAQNTEQQIKEEFEELHQFLRDEEAARIAALREEEKQKSKTMKEKIENINRVISSLSDTIRAIEEEMGADDITFLQNYKSTVERAQCPLQDPERVSGALIDVAKHLGNLKVRVWEKMQDTIQYSPVILDPNTAHHLLVLSEDLTSVKLGTEQKLPDNPERFDRNLCVLGSEGFNSGTHHWAVDVGDGKSWMVGVKAASGQRKGDLSITSGVWRVTYINGEYKARSPSQPKILLFVSQKLQRIRMRLALDSGKLSFFNHDDNTHLHTFTNSFTERVFPCFLSWSPMRIIPMKV
ncbi:zinc-binding protein A33-like isoform X1 [Sardina pilchardus]|uniref:zinc-binding protein A33-like isoform X1 n=1 Tax=Sardina pilchardus TaxID=27697 RepID=UPI002E105725